MNGDTPSQYVTHQELREVITDLSDAIKEQGAEFRKSLTLFRGDVRADISGVRPDSRLLLGALGLLVVMLGMSAGLVAFSMRASVRPMEEVQKYQADLIKAMTGQMQNDNVRELADARERGIEIGRSGEVGEKIKSTDEKIQQEIKVVNTVVDGNKAVSQERFDRTLSLFERAVIERDRFDERLRRLESRDTK